MTYMQYLMEAGTTLSLDTVLSNIKTCFNCVYEIIAENTLLAVCFGLGVIVPVAFKAFNKAKRAAS